MKNFSNSATRRLARPEDWPATRRLTKTGLVSHVPIFAILWTATRQALLSLGFPRQEYWGGLPFPSPGDLFLTEGLNPCLLCLLHCRQTLYPLSHQGKARRITALIKQLAKYLSRAFSKEDVYMASKHMERSATESLGKCTSNTKDMTSCLPGWL